MKKQGLIGRFLVVQALVLLMTCSLTWASNALPPNSKLPEFTLEIPQKPEVQQYLGLKESKAFTLSALPAKLLVVEFFSVVCPVCHRQAPVANRLYQFIQNDSALQSDVKMLGIALGSKPNELAVYSQTFNIPFPLFADPNKEIQNKSKIENIPLTVVLDKNGTVLASHLGVIKDLEVFFRDLKEIYKKQ